LWSFSWPALLKGNNNEEFMGDPGKEKPEQSNGADDDVIDQSPLYRKKKVVIPVLLLLAAGIAGWFWYQGMRAYVSTDDAFVDANRVSISTKMMGRVTELRADEGDTVHKGDVIVRLDDSDLQAQEDQSRAALTLAQVSINLAKTNFDKATDDYKRISEQYKSKVVPKEQFDHAGKGLSAAQAECQIAQARIQAAKAQLQVIVTQRQNCTVSSPLDGVVARRWILPGDVVQPGQPILSVYDVNNLWITANFEETKLTRIHLKDPVEIAVDTYPDTTLHGEVMQLGTHTASEFSLIPPNNASGNFTKVTQRVPVKISIAHGNASPSLHLLPGMSVEVKVKD
jgi:membrane fusion protein, multidrug efflux system